MVAHYIAMRYFLDIYEVTERNQGAQVGMR